MDRLQITKKERTAFALLFGALAILFISNLLITERYNYSQENYDEILAEFERKSALLYQKQKEVEERYQAVAPPEINEQNPGSEAAEATGIETVVLEGPINSDLKSKEKAASAASGELININTATAEQLKLLKGIGDATARNIIEYRTANGNFKSADDLLKVKGIGEKRLESLLPFIEF